MAISDSLMFAILAVRCQLREVDEALAASILEDAGVGRALPLDPGRLS